MIQIYHSFTISDFLGVYIGFYKGSDLHNTNFTNDLHDTNFTNGKIEVEKA